jgi:hypothetical protein
MIQVSEVYTLNFQAHTFLSTRLSLSAYNLRQDNDLIFGKCSHVYHRGCIMQWMQDGHDECPNCRQLMWEPETYKYIEESIKQHGLCTFLLQGNDNI